jgi:hypothetical protein
VIFVGYGGVDAFYLPFKWATTLKIGDGRDVGFGGLGTAPGRRNRNYILAWVKARVFGGVHGGEGNRSTNEWSV